MHAECAFCRWWRRDAEWKTYGECRRRAPVTLFMHVVAGDQKPYMNDSDPEAFWPKTQSADGCGDWTSKEISA